MSNLYALTTKYCISFAKRHEILFIIRIIYKRDIASCVAYFRVVVSSQNTQMRSNAHYSICIVEEWVKYSRFVPRLHAETNPNLYIVVL